MVQDNNKRIILLIFSRTKRVWITGTVHKMNVFLDPEKSRRIMQWLELYIPSYRVPVTNTYYQTHYINGRDLFGDRPFFPSHGKNRKIILSDEGKYNLKHCIERVKSAEKALGYTLGDVTRRNTIIDHDWPYLVDFDDLAPEVQIDEEILKLLI